MSQSPFDLHQETVRRYHEIRQKYGLEAIGTCTLQEQKHGFIRGRKADANNLKPTANHFSYPPPQYCREYGRANIPGHPVFYAGETPEVIADEIRLLDEDWLHLSVFYTPNPTEMELLLLLHDDYSADSGWADMRDQLRGHIEANPNNFGKTPLVWPRIQSSALQFRSDDYQDTSAISHFWLYEKKIDAIVYPSVRSDVHCNFAISPDFVDQHMTLHRAYVCHWKGGQFKISFTASEETPGVLRWSETTEDDFREWEQGFSNLISD